MSARGQDVGLALLVGVWPVFLRTLAMRWLPGPGGSDPDLWVLSAHNLSVGAESPMPPLFPSLLRPALWAGLDGVTAAVAVSTLALALVGVGSVLLVRWAGGGRGLAVLAGVLATSTPAVAVLSLKAQPDALVALTLLGASAVAWRWVREEKVPHAVLVALVLTVALAPLLRAHGLLVGLLLCGLAFVGGRGRTWVGAAAVAAMGLGPLALGLLPDWPWDLPWHDRLFRAVVSDNDPMAGLPEEVRRALVDLDSPLPGFFDRPIWALRQAPGCWSWGAVGLASALTLGWRDRALVVGLLPALTALLTWSSPRHVAVAVPVAVVLWAIGLSRASRTHWWVAGGAIAGLLSLVQAVPVAERLVIEARRVDTLRSFGKALCAEVEPGDLGTGSTELFLYCPLPLHQPDGSGTDWRVWAVGRRPQGPGWVRQDVGHQRVYRLASPPGLPRPCSELTVADDTPFVATPVEPAHGAPTCEGPARLWQHAPAKEDSVLESRRVRPGGRKP